YRKQNSAVLQQSWQQLLAWLDEGALTPHISATYALAEAPVALTSLMERRATGKVVVTIV
ncbi:MAG: zinc-binding dehydrogenase, partial [Proteobacteria bacterium]|nr:zinc-binding dehydrogenase [Pseudomonadota bacterium]